MYAYVGSFNYVGSEGIHLCEYDEGDGRLRYVRTMYPHINAGSLCIYRNLLLATDEASSGHVYCFEVNPQTGELTERSCTETLGINPSYITIDSKEQYVIVTHFAVGEPVKLTERSGHGYVSRLRGNDSPTCLYRLDREKGLGELLDVGMHVPEHGFMTMFHKAYESPDHTFFAENDLGDNQVYFFRIENEKLRCISRAAVGQGEEGPRHGAFHPRLPYLYLNYEHKSKVSRLDISDLNHVTIAEELELFEPGEVLAPEDNQSEIMFSPDGKLLYNFMRAKGIAYVIEVDEVTGGMKLKQKFHLPGNDPRGARYSPDERFILIEGHNSGMVYTLDLREDGTLCYQGKACAMAHPACIAFYQN